MSNRRVCSKNITIDGVKVSFATHTFWALAPDGNPFRVRHYRDLLRTGIFSGERPFDMALLRTGVSHPAALRVLALAKSDPAVDTNTIADILDWSASGMEGFPVGFARGKSEAGMPNAVLGVTLDARRATNVKLPADRALLGEGGWGHARGPVAELLMLARSDRSSDAFYESAADRGERRRRLVARIVAKEPAALAVLVEELRGKDKLRTAALMIAVDAAVAGHRDAERLLTMVMQRPDEPGLVLRYFFDAYRDGRRSRIPSPIRRAVADAATRLYSEDAALRFDRRRFVGVQDRSVRGTPVRFRDVLALTHPVPRDREQSDLFGFLCGGGNPPPLLAARDRLSGLAPELVVDELAREAARLAGGGRPGPLSRIPWEMLASLSSMPRVDVPAAEELLAAAKAERDDVLSTPANQSVFRAERRLRTRVRDAARRAVRVGGVEGAAAHRAAAAELAAFRASEEFRTFAAQRRTVTGQVEVARRHLTAVAKGPGTVPAPVWGVALPGLSDAQVCSLLGAFDRSRIDEATRARVVDRLSVSRVSIPDILRTVRGAALAASGDRPLAVANARLSGAWTSLPASSWEPVLERLAAEKVAEKLPTIHGRVLVLVDGSGSMRSEVSARRNDLRADGYQSLSCADVAGFAAAAIASRCANPADVYVYDTSVVPVPSLPHGALAATRSIVAAAGGGGTDTHKAIAETWDGHDLLVVLTDEQTSFVPGQRVAVVSYGGHVENPSTRAFRLPDAAKVVTVNLAGYAGAQFPDSENRRSISGWSEALFDEIKAMTSPRPPAGVSA